MAFSTLLPECCTGHIFCGSRDSATKQSGGFSVKLTGCDVAVVVGTQAYHQMYVLPPYDRFMFIVVKLNKSKYESEQAFDACLEYFLVVT